MTEAATRYALLLEYDGAGFVGWQRQALGVSIQQVVEQAAQQLAGDGKVFTVVAGRTDAGVHAEGQVVQLHLPCPAIDPSRLRDALNFHMKPHAVVVVRAATAPDGWNARFSATARAYRYVILDRRARPGLSAGRVWHVPVRLDVEAMQAGARALVGHHDFSSFRASSCQAKSPVRTLERLDVTRDADRVVIDAEARSFLHHQVRNMVGTLRLVGGHRWPVGRVATALAARDRAEGGPTAPPEGLTMISVRYAADPFGTATAG